jgi:hypothetical protein
MIEIHQNKSFGEKVLTYKDGKNASSLIFECVYDFRSGPSIFIFGFNRATTSGAKATNGAGGRF